MLDGSVLVHIKYLTCDFGKLSFKKKKKVISIPKKQSFSKKLNKIKNTQDGLFSPISYQNVALVAVAANQLYCPLGVIFESS